MSTQASNVKYTVASGGGTKNYTLNQNAEINYIVANGSAVTIAADMNFTTADTPKEGALLRFIYIGGVTSDVAGGKEVNFFGKGLTDSQALKGAFVLCFYRDAAWNVLVLPSIETSTASIDAGMLAADSVITAKILDKNVTLAKLADASAQGNILLSGASNTWTQLVAKTNAYMLIGNGTTLASVAQSGPVTFDNTGLSSIGAGTITEAMLAFSLVGEELNAEVSIDTSDILTGNGTPMLIVGAPGANFGIEVISASQTITYNSAAYTTNTISRLITDTATVPQMVDNDILLSTVTRTLRMDTDFTIGATDTMIIANKGLYWDVKTGNPAVGDSNIKVKVRYRIINM